MELRRYFNLIRRRLFLVILTMIVGAGVGYLITSRTSLYTANAKIYVGANNIAADPTQLYAEPGLDQVVETFAAMIPSPVIAQKAINATHLHRFSGEVANATVALVVPDTTLIQVSVTDFTKSDAIKLTNAVTRAFVNQIASYQGGVAPTVGTVPDEPANVFQDAVNASKASNGLLRQILLGALFGLAIAILFIFLLDYLDITIKSPEELERRVGLPILGIVPLLATLPENGTASSSASGTVGLQHG